MTSKKGNLPALVAAFAAGASLSEAARAANVSVSTAQRRLKEPDVAQAVEEARIDLSRQAMARALGLREQAWNRVTDVLAHPESATLGLRAAEMVLRHAASVEAAWVQERITVLEHRVQEAEARHAQGDPT